VRIIETFGKSESLIFSSLYAIGEYLLPAMSIVWGVTACFAPQKLMKKGAKPLGERSEMAIKVCGAIGVICGFALLVIKLRE
jgi:hypothetical protein